MEAFTHLEPLLASLERLNIQLRLESGRLRYVAPQGALDSSLREQLQARRAELIAFLHQREMAGARALETRTCPASFIQRRFWSLQQLNPAEAFYNVPFAFRLSGPLDTAALRQSLNAIVQRHEILRTTLHESGGQLVQVIAPRCEVNMSMADLRSCHSSAKAGRVASLLNEEIKRPFDLAREPGLRVLLAQQSSDEHVLLLCLHNTLYDQSSLMVLLDDLSVHYRALSAGIPASLPPATQYAEYAAWQNGLLRAGMDERVRYWRDWFKEGPPPKWTWACSQPPPLAPAFHSHVTWLRCSPELTHKLKAMAQRLGATIYTILLAAYAILLRHYTACTDLTIGTTYSNRQELRFASIVGPTIDVPALRIEMKDNPALQALIARVRNVVLPALTYQDVPFEQIAPGLQLPETPKGPLFRVVFTFFPETPHGRLKLPGIEADFLEEVINELSRPDLYLVSWENNTSDGRALTLYWMHKQDVFYPETARQMNHDFHSLLSTIVSHPAETVEELLTLALGETPVLDEHCSAKKIEFNFLQMLK